MGYTNSPSFFFTFQYVSINTGSWGALDTVPIYFTFQYVSINTMQKLNHSVILTTLHSNMFLLIRDLTIKAARMRLNFTFQYVSINTENF